MPLDSIHDIQPPGMLRPKFKLLCNFKNISVKHRWPFIYRRLTASITPQKVTGLEDCTSYHADMIVPTYTECRRHQQLGYLIVMLLADRMY